MGFIPNTYTAIQQTFATVIGNWYSRKVQWKYANSPTSQSQNPGDVSVMLVP